MASLEEIKQGLSNTILAYMAEYPDVSLFAYSDVPEVAQTPAIIIQPRPREPGDFNGAFSRGLITWELDVMIMVGRSDYEVSQEALTKLIDPAEEKSIARACDSDHEIGLDDGTDAMLSGLRLYGGQLQNANIPHVCAVLSVTVRTPGA